MTLHRARVERTARGRAGASPTGHTRDDDDDAAGTLVIRIRRRVPAVVHSDRRIGETTRVHSPPPPIHRTRPLPPRRARGGGDDGDDDANTAAADGGDGAKPPTAAQAPEFAVFGFRGRKAVTEVGSVADLAMRRLHLPCILVKDNYAPKVGTNEPKGINTQRE